VTEILILGFAAFVYVFLEYVWHWPDYAHKLSAKQKRIARIGRWIGVGALVIWLAIFHRGWGELGLLRGFVMVAALGPVWAILVSRPNYIQGGWLLRDRGFVAGSYLLSGFHPAGLALLLPTILNAHRSQGAPVHRSRTDYALPIACIGGVLAYSVALPLAELMNSAFEEADVVQTAFWFTGGIVCAFYFKPAVGKLWMGGWLKNDLGNLNLATDVQNRWDCFLKDPKRLKFLRKWAGRLNFFFLIGTLVLEILPWFSGLHPLLLWGFMLGLVAMHASIFLLSGICFWKWALADIAFAGFAMGALEFGWTSVWMIFGVMIVLSAASRWVYNLAWYDSPVSHRFEFLWVGKDGSITRIPPEDFEPCGFPVAQARFHFMHKRKTLQGCFGAVFDRKVINALNGCRSVADYEVTREKLGKVQYDAAKTELWSQLLQAFMADREGSERGPRWTRYFPMPSHIWSGLRGPDVYPEAAAIRVHYVECVLLSQHIVTVYEETVLEVPANPGKEGDVPASMDQAV